MTTYEIISIILTCIGLVLQVFGIIYIVKNLEYVENQINLSKKVHEDTLEWNKKIATEAELANKPDKEIIRKLNDLFRERMKQGTIPLEVILEEIKKDPPVEGNIASILNRHERIARGIKLQIYSEEIVMSAVRTRFIRIYNRYSSYIAYYQKKYNSQSWIQFQNLIQGWKK